MTPSQARLTGRLAALAPLIASLHGAAGLLLGAAAAHVEASPLLATASNYLLIHAAAGLGLAALAERREDRRLLIAATLVLQAGATLFALDLAVRGYGGARLFPFAAPIGGSTMILGWVALAGLFAAALLKPRPNVS